MSDTERKNSAFWEKHPYLEVYTYFVGYGTLYLGPVFLIGGLIDYGWTTEALIPLLGFAIMVVFFPLFLFVLICLFRGILS